jgi:hypothetical protein
MRNEIPKFHSPNAQSDEALMKAIAAGDQSAMRTLYARRRAHPLGGGTRNCFLQNNPMQSRRTSPASPAPLRSTPAPAISSAAAPTAAPRSARWRKPRCRRSRLPPRWCRAPDEKDDVVDPWSCGRCRQATRTARRHLASTSVPLAAPPEGTLCEPATFSYFARGCFAKSNSVFRVKLV